MINWVSPYPFFHHVMNVIIIAVPQMGLHYYFLQLYTMYNMGDIADWIFKICRRPREQFTSWQGSSKLVGTARNLLTHCLLIIPEGEGSYRLSLKWIYLYWPELSQCLDERAHAHLQGHLAAFTFLWHSAWKQVKGRSTEKKGREMSYFLKGYTKSSTSSIWSWALEHQTAKWNL